MNYNHLLDVLVKCYLSDNIHTTYSGRWDVWLVQNKHIDEFMMLTLKTDDQLNRILEHARQRAEAIKNSPLTKALMYEH